MYLTCYCIQREQRSRCLCTVRVRIHHRSAITSTSILYKYILERYKVVFLILIFPTVLKTKKIFFLN